MKRIYILDDDPMYREALLQHLREHIVIAFSDSVSCKKEINKKKPDVLVLDYYLHDTTGLDFYREIKEEHDGIRVIVLSKNEEGSKVLELMREGIVDYVVKDPKALDMVKDLVDDNGRGDDPFDSYLD